jgi:serine/threonine protein kinase
MSSTNNINNKLLNLMRKGIRNISYNNAEYNLIGRGGEANVYTYDSDSNIAIKVYRYDSICYDDPTLFDKEIYVVRFLKDHDQINDHIVDLYEHVGCDKNNSNGSGYVFMELYDGDLDSWARISTTRGTEASESEWISMIFQVFFAFTTLNELGVLHGDSKPKNVFYTKRNLKDPNTDGVRSYLIDGKSYEIPFTTRFVLGDFSRVRVAELDPDLADPNEILAGLVGTGDLYFDLTHRADLYELSRLLYRVMVNSVIRTFEKDKIENLVDHHAEIDREFGQKIEKNRTEIREMDVPDKIRDRMLLRFYAYELIEAEYITQEQMGEANPNLVLPSKSIQNLLVRLTDPNETYETLFKDRMI